LVFLNCTDYAVCNDSIGCCEDLLDNKQQLQLDIPFVAGYLLRRSRQCFSIVGLVIEMAYGL